MLVLTVWLLIIGGCSAGLQSVDCRVDGLVVDNKEGAAPVYNLLLFVLTVWLLIIGGCSVVLTQSVAVRVDGLWFVCPFMPMADRQTDGNKLRLFGL